jgi:hypothetical protein
LIIPPIAIETARRVQIAMNGRDLKTSQSYQASTKPSVNGRRSAMFRGTELPRSVPIRTRRARKEIS